MAFGTTASTSTAVATLSADATNTATDTPRAKKPNDVQSRFKKQKFDMRTRIKHSWKGLTERPSLLSSTSDSMNASASASADEDFEKFHSSTDRDPRLYRETRLPKIRRRSTHTTRLSQDQSRMIDSVGADEDAELKDEKPTGVTTKVVVDNDFSSWIDPTTGRVKSTHDYNEEDSASIQTGGKSEVDQTETSQHYSRLQKVTDDLHMPWMGHFMENVRYFFDMSFPGKKKERSYLKDVYIVRRQIAMSASLFCIVMWILVCVTTPRPYDQYDYYAVIGIYGALTLPLLPIIYFNVNYRMPICYQLWLTLATWVLPEIMLIKVKICGVWEPGNTCDTRSFFIAFASAIGQPALALLALNQNRFCAVLGAGQFFVLIAIFYLHESYTPSSFYRDIVYYVVFHVIILIIDAFLERRDRQMFELREQLKAQFMATQRAQQAEKQASDLKKRFASYIFHEVRVPLNTATLAIQNLQGDGVFDTISKDQKEMVHGLASSLQLMEKVLNDVLSFNRMESGKFSQAKVPFDFHRSVVLTALSHSATAQSKGVALTTDLDPRIDQLGCSVIGDELRLRQVTSNLVSNSLKFTVAGSVQLRTRLLLPAPPIVPEEPIVSHHHTASGSTGTRTSQHDASVSFRTDIEKGLDGAGNDGEGVPAEIRAGRRPSMAIIRIEIADTGVGLRSEDMVENHLFSPYVQTEIGRRQGGKGTGLGLALVRQIVELNKGRLGVDSEYGKGSTFWLELPYQLKRRSVSEPGHNDSVASSKTLVEKERERSCEPILPEGWTGMVQDPGTSTSIASPQPILSREIESDDPAHTCTPSNQTELESPMSPQYPVTPGERGGPLHALVVDDDRLTRLMMKRMLERLGHRVITAEHGKEGLQKIDAAYHLKPDSSPVDVVFLDNQMPYMSGVEVSRAVRSTGNPVYIIGCTGNALKEDQEEYLEAGADRVLTKPIKQAAILEAIESARRRLGGENVPKEFEREDNPHQHHIINNTSNINNDNNITTPQTPNR